MTGAVVPSEPPESPVMLVPGASRLAVIDAQTGLLPHVRGGAAVAARCALLARGAKALGVPVRASVQAPDKLGDVADDVAAALREADCAPAPKTAFGAAAVLKLTEAVSDARHQVVLCGVETHVCVSQTALELMSAGYAVTVAADACGSRSDRDHGIALGRLRDEGVAVSTAEAVLFEWCRSAKNPAFPALRDLVKAAAGSGA